MQYITPHGPISLCRKEKICYRCDIAYILKHYIKPLLTLLNKDLTDFGLYNETKCLNTAILLIIFLAGMKKGRFIIDYCDCEKTRQRHLNGQAQNHIIMGSMMKAIASKKFKLRQLYYIMITDGHFPKVDGNGSVYFPGHVFIIEKMRVKEGEDPKYYIYQSYINQYTLNGHYEKMSNKVELSYEQACYTLHRLSYILTKGIWDEICVKYWKEITHVESPEFLNTITKNNLFLCYQTASTKGCVQNIEKFIKQKKKLLEGNREENKELIDSMNNILKDIEANTRNFI